MQENHYRRFLLLSDRNINSFGYWTANKNGSMIPLATQFQDKGFGVVLLNPNLNSINEIPIEGSESAAKHLKYVVSRFSIFSN